MTASLTPHGLGATPVLPVSFDAEAFVTDLLAAGCHVSVHEPVGPGAGPAYVQVTPADLAGTPTAGEREVRARWAAAMAACPDADQRVLAVVPAARGARGMTAAQRVTHAAVLLWWAPSFIALFARPALFQVGFTYRARRARRLMDAGQLDVADRLIGRLREDAERYRRRVAARYPQSSAGRPPSEDSTFS